MRTNLTTNLLVGLVVLSILATSVMAVTYVQSVRRLNMLQLQSAVMNRNRTLASALANDVMEYSKRNPAIDPLLQSVGLKPKTNAAAAPNAPKKP